MKQALSLLAAASLVLFVAGCDAAGTGPGIDPTPGDQAEGGAYGNGPTDGPLGGLVPDGLNFALLCDDFCAQAESCGGLDDGETAEGCSPDCATDSAKSFGEASSECLATLAAWTGCTLSLSCEDLAVYDDPGEELEASGDYPCAEEDAAVELACFADLAQDFADDLEEAFELDGEGDGEGGGDGEGDGDGDGGSSVPSEPAEVDPEDPSDPADDGGSESETETDGGSETDDDSETDDEESEPEPA